MDNDNLKIIIDTVENTVRVQGTIVGDFRIGKLIDQALQLMVELKAKNNPEPEAISAVMQAASPFPQDIEVK